MNNLKSKSEPTARQAAANVDAKKEVIANPNLAIAKNLVVKQSASAGLVGSYKLTSDPKLASVLAAKSTTNEVIGVYLPLSLGNVWGKGRGSQKLRDAMGGDSFTIWTRV